MGKSSKLDNLNILVKFFGKSGYETQSHFHMSDDYGLVYFNINDEGNLFWILCNVCSNHRGVAATFLNSSIFKSSFIFVVRYNNWYLLYKMIKFCKGEFSKTH